ncbi:MAG: ECF-type sigma factor [Phycisphaerales bacterium]
MEPHRPASGERNGGAAALTPPTEPGEVTRLIGELGRDDGSAAARLMPMIEHELRGIAGRLFHRESPGHTLQPTALVHEAFLKLSAYAAGHADHVPSPAAPESAAWNDRDHFFAIAATAMRQVLVDHARRSRAARRGGTERGARIPLDEVAGRTAAAGPDVLDLDDALRELEVERPRVAQVVHLRFFAGMTEEAAARVLGVSRNTASADWAFARAWLARRLGRNDRATD